MIRTAHWTVVSSNVINTMKGWGGQRTQSIAAVCFLIVATALNNFSFGIASLNVRPEHIAFAIVAGLGLIQTIRHRAVPTVLRDDGLLVLLISTALIASVLDAPDRIESLKFLGLMAFGVALYWLIRELVLDSTIFTTAVIAVIAVGIGEAILGVMGWLDSPWHITRGQFFGFAPESILANCVYTFAPRGTLIEANVFGSYLTAVSLVVLVLMGVDQTGWSKRALGVATTLLLISVGLSLSRGAWLGLGVGLIFVLRIRDAQPRGTRFKLIAYAATIVALVGTISVSSSLVAPSVPTTLPNQPSQCATATSPSDKPKDNLSVQPPASAIKLAETGPGLPERITLAAERILSTITMGDRLRDYQRALTSWRQHPWIGNGANTFAQKTTNPNGKKPWISHMELMELHDTGLIGLLLLVAWLIWVGRDAVRVLKVSPPGLVRIVLTALCVGFVALLVAYQFTTALWLGFTWVYLGLIRAGTLILQRKNGLANQ